MKTNIKAGGWMLAFLLITNILFAQETAKVSDIRQEQLSTIMQKERAILIDVRTPGEVSQGYIDGASQFIDVYSPDFQKKMERLYKNKTYVVYCRSGARSAQAGERMISMGFTKVYNLQGGISNWKGSVKKP